ncbi:MAG: hypothetical protein ACE5HR_00240 [bacterium]
MIEYASGEGDCLFFKMDGVRFRIRKVTIVLNKTLRAVMRCERELNIGHWLIIHDELILTKKEEEALPNKIF